ncbi:aspartate aminotransferase family protein [Chelatococcus reniformis]|uniref:Adenosylmethionine-8-amino-7-oxononanoate aminotransferase n=1 Tax=Chelatococcus reniformis TaxID=1494448 RepID=A0A916TXG8_9HYPH|nr:aspartate aminotransferase family protein [Chelatococcus reniformis]GGC44859.1 adenosylmethionine-8-amino-7-oxononanoate aminotransferase [Chelatococcus reniformis]
MTILPNSLHARDVAYQFHPYTNARRHERIGPMVIDRGSGVYVYDDQGREYIEALAGLWSVAVGFGEQRLVDAATRQMARLPYYHTFSHKSHEPSIELAEKLVKMSPDGLDHVFFTNSGSEANDTVVKLAWYYNNALDRPQKKKFIARNGGYHGITVVAGSLTGLQVNQRGFDLPLPFVRHVTCPHHYRYAEAGESEEAFADRLAAELEATILAEGPDTVAAFIGEPVMGAGGVLVPPRTYWQKVQEVCRRYDVLVVADEVINGFGRLGTLFACETFDIKPDLLVVSKQITSSYQPLAAVLFSDAVYQAIADQTERLGNFGHGFTASGHPVATAVGLENLAIIEERGLVANAAKVGARLQAGLATFADHPLVGEVRGIGLIGAVELVADKATKAKFDPPGKVGLYLFERAQEHGLIVRAIADTIAFCPPLIITEAQIDEVLARFGRALDDTQAWVVAGMPAV